MFRLWLLIRSKFKTNKNWGKKKKKNQMEERKTSERSETKTSKRSERGNKFHVIIHTIIFKAGSDRPDEPV